MATMDTHDPWSLRESYLYDRTVIAEIQRAAREGIYDIRGFGAKRRVPHFDDLLFLGASISRYPLEGYRERCDTDVTLGTRFAKKPLELKIPVTIAGMSFGALSAPAKEALGRGASEVGTSTTTGDGGMTPEERDHSKILVYQVLPSRYGMNPDDLRKADAIEIVVGQGAKPGGGGMLLGHKISDRVAEMRNLPRGIDQRSASRHPDWTGPTTSRSRSVSSARSPTGRSRSSSRSARHGRTTTCSSP
jgi:glutamate synthase domain-containing protein 2